jgi:hypothetical protein
LQEQLLNGQPHSKLPGTQQFLFVVLNGFTAFAHAYHKGERHSRLSSVGGACPWASIGCAFNHRRLFACCQPDDSVLPGCGGERQQHGHGVSYLFEEPSLWQELAVEPGDVPGPGWYAVLHHGSRGVLAVSGYEK